MAKQTIKVSTKDKNGNVVRSIEVEYDFGGNLKEMAAKFGEQKVFEHAEDNMIIALQAFVRNRLVKVGDKKVSDGSIRTDVAGWKPGTRKPADPVKKQEQLVKDIRRMDATMRANLLALLKEEGTKLVKSPAKKTA